jgi:hypothetical protein
VAKSFTFNQTGAKRIVDVVRQVERVGALGFANQASATNSTETVLAKLTDQDGSMYAWSQVRIKEDGTVEVVTDGLTGTLSERTAYEINGNEWTQINDIVLLTRLVVAVDDTTNDTVWGFQATIPRPQVQYDVFEAVAQNVPGWDRVRAHPDLS